MEKNSTSYMLYFVPSKKYVIFCFYILVEKYGQSMLCERYTFLN